MKQFFGRKGTFGLILLALGSLGFALKSESVNLNAFFTFLTGTGGLFFLGNVGEHFAKKEKQQ